MRSHVSSNEGCFQGETQSMLRKVAIPSLKKIRNILRRNVEIYVNYLGIIILCKNYFF